MSDIKPFKDWLPADLSKRPAPPLVSAVSRRSAGAYKGTISQFSVETSLRYQRRDVTDDGISETFCNFFVVDVSIAMSCELPQMRANNLLMWLTDSAAKGLGWQWETQTTAVVAAMRGQMVVVGWRNPEPNASGHVALVLPEPGCWIAQAGRRNHERCALSQGFGKNVPLLFFSHQ